MYYTNNHKNRVHLFDYLYIGGCSIESAAEVLQDTARKLQESADALNLETTGSAVVRYNGREYAVILPAATQDEKAFIRAAKAAGIKQSKSQNF